MHLTPPDTICSGLLRRATARDALTAHRADGQCLLHKAIEKLASRTRCPAVEPEGKLVEVIAKMRGLHSALMGPGQPTFQQGRHPVRQGQQILPYLTFLTNRAVQIALEGQGPVATPAICAHVAARLHALLDGSGQLNRRRIGYLAQANAPQFRAFVLYRYHNQCLSRRSAAPLARPFTTDICLVHLNHPRQPIPTRTHHRMTQFVKPCPSCSITPQSQNALQPQGTHPVLLIRHVPYGTEPKSQRLSRILKNRSRRNGRLETTPVAQVQPPPRHPGRQTPTTRALEPTWPAHPNQILQTGLLRCEALLKFEKCLRVIFHTPAYYRLCLVESSA